MNFTDIVLNTIIERKKLIKLFSLITLGCLSLIILRLFIHADRTFIFLLWNFFLALIPLMLSSVLLQMNKQKYSIYTMLFLGVCWMLFYPNGPYILTDFIHITCSNEYYLSLDILTISWFAIAALLAALISLNDVSTILLSRYRQKRVSFIILGLSLLTGFGIYLGRYLRFNSWDIIQKPHVIFSEVSERIVNPTLHPRTWMITVGFGMLLFFVYQGIKTISREFTDSKNIRLK